jgi:hypothetical protein
MSAEAASRPTETRRRRLAGALAYPAAAFVGYYGYLLGTGLLAEGAKMLVGATLKSDWRSGAFDVLYVVCGLLGGVATGAVAVLLWPARSMILVSALLGSPLAWEEMARSFGYLLVLRTPVLMVGFAAALVGIMASYRTVRVPAKVARCLAGAVLAWGAWAVVYNVVGSCVSYGLHPLLGRGVGSDLGPAGVTAESLLSCLAAGALTAALWPGRLPVLASALVPLGLNWSAMIAYTEPPSLVWLAWVATATSLVGFLVGYALVWRWHLRPAAVP